jgi:hypothetical protein
LEKSLAGQSDEVRWDFIFFEDEREGEMSHWVGFSIYL